MARRMRYPENVKRGERMTPGKRYRIVGSDSKQVGFKGTLLQGLQSMGSIGRYLGTSGSQIIPVSGKDVSVRNVKGWCMISPLAPLL